MNDAPPPILEVEGLFAGYGDLAAVRDLNLVVGSGEIVALLGPNGAGKTTTLKTLAGAMPAIKGTVRWNGEVVTSPLHRRVRQGMGFIPEERSVIAKLSVRDNLSLGRGPVDRALKMFPQLQPLLGRAGGLLSGGEQQMLTLARCLASKPSIMLVDELSLGLAPIIVKSLFSMLRTTAVENGTAVLMVEQQVQRALSVADRWYLLRHGALAGSGVTAGTGVNELAEAYM
jgi:branched-chain amino acid transport system ATP-binding protein